MARDSTELDENRDGRIPRRSYLKLAGATAAAVGIGGAATSSVSADEEYEIVEARGQTIWLDDGETYENKLVDVTTGAGIDIYARGSSNVTIRNIGVRGLYTGDGFVIAVGDPDPDGHTVVENVYLADGANKDGEDFVHGPGGIFVGTEHRGTVTFRNCNVQGFPNNGIYGSSQADGSEVHFENCYGKNNGVSTFRLAEGTITDCVAYNDNTDYGEGWDYGDYGGYGETNGRPFWAWAPGPVDIERSHFSDGPYPYAGVCGESSPTTVNYNSGAYSGQLQEAAGTLNVSDAVGSNPDLSVPDDVPTSPEEAAGGEPRDDDGGSGDYPDLAHSYEFVAADDQEYVDYYLEVEEGGDLHASTINGAEIDDDYHWISDDGTKAAGRIHDGRHAYEFDSLVLDVTLEGSADVYVDEQPSSLDRYPLDGASGDDWKGGFPWQDSDDEELAHVLLVDGVGTEGVTEYEFSVSGAVEPSTDRGATIDEDAVIDGGSVSGSVAGWRDAYRFGGSLEELTVDGDAQVYVDGEPVDPGEFDDRVNVLTLVGDGRSTRFEMTVSGDLEMPTFGGKAPADMGVILSGPTAEGAIESSVYYFRFTGSLLDLTLDGDATVYLNGERVDPDDYSDSPMLPHAIVIDGSDADGESEYEFTVYGDLEPADFRDATIDDDDEIDGRSVSGTVTDWRDAYWFDGHITDFRLFGDASVDVEYNVRDQ